MHFLGFLTSHNARPSLELAVAIKQGSIGLNTHPCIELANVYATHSGSEIESRNQFMNKFNGEYIHKLFNL